jgi:hypothetical protein
MPDTSGPGPVALQEPPAWAYDFNPATGSARASFTGEVTFISGGAGSPVTSFNTRTGAIVLTTADVTGAGGLAGSVGQLPGIASNVAATAGNVGEYVTASVAVGAAVGLTTNVAANVTSIPLTAGDWDVEGIVCANYGSSNGTGLSGWISTTTASQPAPGTPGLFQIVASLTLSTSGQCFATGKQRFSLNATTTVYLSALATFAGSGAAWGSINARRVR